LNFSRIFLVIFSINLVAFPVRATGLYFNLPNHFSNIDTSKVSIVFHQSELKLVDGEASFIYGELDLKTSERFLVRLALSYSVVDRDVITDGLGDGYIYGDFRISGDTLNIEGLYVRCHLRLPMGSVGIAPFSYASLESGIGIEGRMKFPLFFMRVSGSYSLSEKKDEELNLGNYALGALSFRFPVVKMFDLKFSGFYVGSKGGELREIYELSLCGKVMDRLHVEAGWLIDSGEESRRVFNTQVFITVRFTFPSSRVQTKMPSTEVLGS